MLVLNYDPVNGGSVADGQVEAFVDSWIAFGRTNTTYLDVGSETILDMFRLKIARNEVDVKDLIFIYDRDIYEVNEYGVLSRTVDGKFGNPPPSFGSDLAGKIINASISKRKLKMAKEFIDGYSLPEATI